MMLKRATNVIEGLEQVLRLSITMLSLFVFRSPNCSSFCILSEVDRVDLYDTLKQCLHLSSCIASAVSAKSALKSLLVQGEMLLQAWKNILEILLKMYQIQRTSDLTEFLFDWTETSCTFPFLINYTFHLEVIVR